MEKSRSFTKQTRMFLIITIIVIIIGVDSAWNSYIVHKNKAASKNWPVTTGEVTETKITMIPDEDGTDYLPMITYHYYVSGVEYFCKNGIHIRGFRDEAEKDLSLFPIGTKIQVSYNPNSPQVCVTDYYGELVPYFACLIPTGVILFFYTFGRLLGKIKE
jgi:hypothetical protein